MFWESFQYLYVFSLASTVNYKNNSHILSTKETYFIFHLLSFGGWGEGGISFAKIKKIFQGFCFSIENLVAMFRRKLDIVLYIQSKILKP